MTKNKIMNLFGILGIVASVIILMISWTQLPDNIPAHYNLAGEADNFAPKWVLLFIPILCLGLYLLMSLMIKKPGIVTNYPYRITPDNKAQHYKIIRDMGSWLRTWIVWTFVYAEFAFINSSVKWIPLSGLTILIPIAITIIGVILIMRKGKNIE